MEVYNGVAGLLVGIMVGITGVGGGALMTPILVLLFGIAPVTAVGTDLWFAAITKLFGGGIHIRRKAVDWQVLWRLSAGSLPAASVTLWVLSLLGMGKIANQLTLFALGGVLFVTSVALLFKQRLHAVSSQWRIREPVHFKKWQPALTVLMGGVLGVVVTLTSVGAGALGTVMLVYLYPFRMTAGKLVGTDIVHAIPLAVVAGTGYLLMGEVNIPLLLTLLAGSIPGVLLGSLLCHRLKEAWVRYLIAFVLAAVGVKMVWVFV